MKRARLLSLWRAADRLLILGIAAFSVIWGLAAVRGFLFRADGGAGGGRAAHGVPAQEEAATAAPPRAVAVPQAAGWVAYGGTAAARGDRRREWAEQGVARREWLEAPAAPAVNVEQTPDGYTVWCLLPQRTNAVSLEMAGDVLVVGSGSVTPGCPHLRFRLPCGGPKRIAGSVVSNGWLRISVVGAGDEAEKSIDGDP